MASQGSLGQRRRQEAVGLLCAVVDFTVHGPGRVTSLCWVQDRLGGQRGYRGPGAKWTLSLPHQGHRRVGTSSNPQVWA